MCSCKSGCRWEQGLGVKVTLLGYSLSPRSICLATSSLLTLNNAHYIRLAVVIPAHSVHDSNRYGVTGFPTIKFFSKDNKDGENVRHTCDALSSAHTHTHTHMHICTHKRRGVLSCFLFVCLFVSLRQYEGGRGAEDFVQYLNGKCGTSRLLGGKLSEEVREKGG